MITVVIIQTLSFLLDGFMTFYIGSDITNLNIFTNIYSLVGIVIIYPLFINKRKYLYSCLIVGLLFDIVYTSTFIFNMWLFFMMGLLIIALNKILHNNIISTIVISLSVMILYYSLSYLVLFLIGYPVYHIKYLLYVILSSIIMCVLYSCILYYIKVIINKKIIIKKVK